MADVVLARQLERFEPSLAECRLERPKDVRQLLIRAAMNMLNSTNRR